MSFSSTCASVCAKAVGIIENDSSNRAFILGVLSAAAIAGAYIFWGPTTTKRRKTRKGKIPGLINLGKSCFVNAVLQGLASSPTIGKWMQVVITKLTPRQSGGENVTLIYALYKILRVLNCQGSEYTGDHVHAEEVLQALRRNRWAISNDEQDAHELFHVLTTTIEEELEKEILRPSLADAADFSDEQPLNPSKCLSKCCINLPKLRREETLHNIPYRGLFACQLRCKKCLTTSPVKFDTFDSLSLSIPNNQWPDLTLRDCLEYFMMPEKVKDVECEKCSALQVDKGGEPDLMKTRSTFIKRLTIGKLPDVLCIHIQRMTWLSNGMPMKTHRHVKFDEYLDMSKFVYFYRPGYEPKGITTQASGLIGGSAVSHRTTPLSNGTGSHFINPLAPSLRQIELNSHLGNGSRCNLFRLQAVIVHLGDVHSGHFITYRKGALQSPYDERWFLCSDTTVHEVPIKHVFNSNAYMLLYERAQCEGIQRL